jgi:hypothetical protein
MSIFGGIFVLQQIYNKTVSREWPKDLFKINSIVNNLSVINEGDSLVISVNTKDAENETLYWILQPVTGTINTSDFSSISGSFVVQSNNYGHFTLTSLEDATTEDEESFFIQIRRDSITGPVTINSGVITINDTSKTPTYFVSANTTTVDEGNTVSFTVTTTNVANNTTLYYNTSQITGTINASDFLDSSLSGSFIINNNTASIGRTINIDSATEGSESFAITIRTGSITGPVVATSETVNINDTSFFIQQYGWFGGGTPGPATPLVSFTSVERIDFISDTSTASTRGPLSQGRITFDATSNSSFGWFINGYSYNITPNAAVVTIDRINYGNDTVTALSRGPSGITRRDIGAVGNQSFGWHAGGLSSDGTSMITRISRIIYSTDSATSLTRSTGLSLWRFGCVTNGDNGDFGWFGGGINATVAPITYSSVIRRLNFSNDTVATTPLASRFSLIKNAYGTAYNNSYGWFAGGGTINGLSPKLSNVDRLDFSNDAVNALVRGNLAITTYLSAGVSSNYYGYGWFGGGRVAAPNTGSTYVQRITFGDDTVTAIFRGNLVTQRGELAGQ